MSNRRKLIQALGGSTDDREVVDFELNQPALREANIIGGGYRVTTAKPSKAADLAASLSSFSTTLSDYAKLQKQAGEDAASKVSDADLYKELQEKDPAAFLTLGRNKAYRNALYKRAMNVNILPQLSRDSRELVNLNEFGSNTDQFIEKRLDPYIAGKWEEFSADVGEYADQPAAQALWLATTSEWRNNIVNNYNKEIDNFIVDAQQQELGLEFTTAFTRGIDPVSGDMSEVDFGRIPSILVGRDKLIAEAANITGSERTDIMAKEVASQASSLLANGRVRDAEKLIATVEATEINGKPVFRAGASAATFAEVKNKIQRAGDEDEVADEKTNAEKRRTFVGKSISVTQNLNAIDDKDQLDSFTRSTIVSTFESINPEISEEEINSSIDFIFNHPISSVEGYKQAMQTLALKSGDEGNDLYFDTVTTINEAQIRAQDQTRIVSSISDEQKQGYLEEYTEWKKVKTNAEKTPKQWISSQDLNITIFDELRVLDKELNKGNWVFKNTYYQENRLTSVITNAVQQVLITNLSDVDEKSEIDFVETTAQGMIVATIPMIQADLLEYARSLDENLSAEERDVEIRNETARLTQQLTNRVNDFNDAYLNRGTVVQGESDKRKAVRLEAMEDNYFAKSYKTATRPYMNIGEVPRDKMLAEGNSLVLAHSLIELGYDSWDPNSFKMLRAAKIGAEDVQLFGNEAELDSVYGEWQSVMNKTTFNERLTEEEEAIKDTYQDFGIFNPTTLNVFINDQRQFFDIETD